MAGPCAAAALLAQSWLLDHHSVTLTALSLAFRKTHGSKASSHSLLPVCASLGMFSREVQSSMYSWSVHASWCLGLLPVPPPLVPGVTGYSC